MTEPSILIVDDRVENLMGLELVLRQIKIKVVQASSGAEALKLCAKQDFSLILMDVQMPGMDGFEAAEILRSRERTRYIPIIFITAINKDEMHVFKGYDVGAVDYLFKPINSQILLAKIRVFVDLDNQRQLVLQHMEELNREIQLREEAEHNLRIQQAELENARNQAIEANKSKSAFLSNMSHEIRTPMNAILGFSELLESMDLDDKSKNYIKNIRTSGKSLLDLINDILDLSKVEAGKLTLQYSPISLKELLSELSLVFSQKIQDKGLSFQVEVDGDLPECLILDETRLRQVLVNFIANAFKFTEKGLIRVRAKAQKIEDKQNLLHLSLSVEDTGMGISPEQQGKIFEAFEQMDGQKVSQFGGTGLGLAISARLIDMMGGKILLKSEEGKGSCFEISLPEVEIADSKEFQQVQNSEQSLVQFAPAKILFADDIDYNRELLSAYLSDLNFELSEARNGQEVLDKALSFQPDIILLDMKMPVMDGYETIRHLNLNNDLKNIPVIAVTASALKTDETKIRQICDGYLRKPVKRLELIDELKNHLTHEVIEPEFPLEEKSKLEALSPEEIIDLLNRCKSTLTPLIDGLAENPSSFNLMMDLSSAIKELSSELPNPELIQWQQDYQKSLDLFDCQQISEQLKTWPKLLENIQNSTL